MKNKKSSIMTIALLTICIINLIISVLYIIPLPDIVPTHIGPDLTCDGIGSKWTFLIIPFIPPLTVFIYPLTKKFAKNADKNEKAIKITSFALMIFFILMTWFSLKLAGSGLAIGDKWGDESLMWLIVMAFGALFVISGNFMPVTKQNKMFGVRIKWTLENENCWRVTHRLFGRLSVACGILLIVLSIVMLACGAPATAGAIIFFTCFMALIVTTVVYAYIHRND